MSDFISTEHYGNILDILSKLRTDVFLKFCREQLGISSTVLEELKKRGDYGKDIKFSHVRKGFDKNPRSFVSRNWSRLPEEYREAYQSSGHHVPQLTSKVVYDLIASYEGEDWRSVAGEYLDVEISPYDDWFGTKVLSQEQIFTLLTAWMNGRGSSEEIARQELQQRYGRFLEAQKQKKRTF